jgi:NAD(P)-dependent dehydrogenase (short-subunit alcohol dehydrogenase family)
MTNFKNKVALITGGNSGIGFATAKLLREQGATVIISGSNAANTEKAAAEIGATGIVADVKQISNIENLVAQAVAKYGNIDYLFINAGIATFAPIEHVTEEGFDEVLDINFKGAFFTLNKSIPHLNDNASVILLSTTMTQLAMENSAVYTSSKAAMSALAKVAAVELAPRGIRVNLLSPGTITTPIYTKLGFPDDALSGFKNAMIASTPLKRFGESSEIAETALHLFSDNSKYITGADFVVDGGIALNKVV